MAGCLHFWLLSLYVFIHFDCVYLTKDKCFLLGNEYKQTSDKEAILYRLKIDGGYKSFWSSAQESTVENVSKIYFYDKRVMDLVNHQVLHELIAFYEYTNMSAFFMRHEYDYPGFARYFQAAADGKMRDAQKLMKYQLKRGGTLNLTKLPAPATTDWTRAARVFASAMKMERELTSLVLCLHELGTMWNDKDFVDFLETTMIPEQYKNMRELKGHKEKLVRMAGTSRENIDLAEFQYDLMLQDATKN